MKQTIYNTLRQDDRLWDKDKKVLNQTLLLDLVEKTDATIIQLLLAQEALRTTFFVKLGDVYVFKTNDFRFFMEEHKVDNSYTAYKNRIGLTDGKRFLKDTHDVVLDFPYKDCVLQGGQSTEEGMDSYFVYQEAKKKTMAGKQVTTEAGYQKKQSKRKEVFFNQVLAQDEIDRLLDEKAFVNWQRFTKEGTQEVGNFKRELDGTLRENLIIKGNNLAALHSLKRQFAGKIKLIYIDPPYNTGNDGFKYNDRFNHSTWLTFMKNRLTIAKELLRDDGVIFVQCDDNEQAYLKVLMDEVFGRENFIASFIWKGKSGGANDSKYVAVDQEYILCFCKKTNVLRFNLDSDAAVSTLYNYKDERGQYALDRLDKQSIRYSKNLDYLIKDKEGNSYYPKHKDKDNPNATWRWSRSTVQEKFNELVFKDGNVYTKNYKKNGSIPRTLLVSERFSRTRTGKTEHFCLFKRKEFDSPKPENLIKFIIQISTQPTDIILDYHLGSGTTAAVAHKMGRQYIGIEQMDYIEPIACERMKKVMAGEQGGISKAVNWQGGGDFIYAELAQCNEQTKQMIESCGSLADLMTLFDTLYHKYFLNYNLKIKEFKDKVIKEAAFQELPLDEQKKMFLIMLDLNQMYVCKSEMADKRFGIRTEDQQLTRNFYNNKAMSPVRKLLFDTAFGEPTTSTK